MGKTVPSVLSMALGLGPFSRPRAQFSPIRTSRPVNNIYKYLINNQRSIENCFLFACLFALLSFFALTAVCLTDIDECRTRGHNCAKQSYCRNTEASYTCECPKGFKNIGMKCSPTRLTRWLTPKYLLSDIKKGVWDSILVVCAVCVVAVALFVIFIVMLRKWCRKCAKKPEYEGEKI